MVPARGKDDITPKSVCGERGVGGVTKKNKSKTPTRRAGNTAIVIQALECTKTEIRDLASLLNFKNNKSLQITLLIGFK